MRRTASFSAGTIPSTWRADLQQEQNTWTADTACPSGTSYPRDENRRADSGAITHLQGSSGISYDLVQLLSSTFFKLSTLEKVYTSTSPCRVFPGAGG